MSRIYFHSEHGEAELHGSERAWLNHLASGPSVSAWDIRDLDRAARVMEMVAEDRAEQEHCGYLVANLRKARDQDARNKSAIAEWLKDRTGPMYGTEYEVIRQFVESVTVCLRVQGLPLRVAGVDLRSANVDLNTALVAGSEPVRLAAKIHGWCESHCWVEGPDRKWMADIIDEGLRAGLYRRGLWYADRPDGPTDKWSDQGWGQVTELLRSRDDGPVVLSFSVCDQFPNQFVGDWMPPWPDGVPERYDALPDDVKAEREDRQEAWYELHFAEQWRISMTGLRVERPWARLGPDTLAEVTFSHPVTVYDLLASDRDERVRRALGSTGDGAT